MVYTTHTHTHTQTQWNTMQPFKEQNFAICGNKDGLEGHYAR